MPIDEPTRYGVAPAGYRLPPATRVGGVRLQVCDIARSLDYYRHVLGLNLLYRSGPDAALGPTGSDAPLIHLREEPGTHPVARGSRLGLYHFAILLADRAALGRFSLPLSHL